MYVPLVPAALTDLLDAPTPFLMGLGGGLGAALAAELQCAGACGGLPGVGGGGGGSGGDGEFSEWFGGGVAARVAEGLIVADLDRCDLAEKGLSRQLSVQSVMWRCGMFGRGHPGRIG